MAILKKYPNKNLPLKHSLKTGAGFTLMETMVYIALFSILMSGAVVGIYNLLEGGNRNVTASLIQEEGTFLNRKISWAMIGSTAVSVSPGGSILTVTRPDLGAQSPLTLSSAGTAMTIERGTGLAIQLNSDRFPTHNVLFTYVAGVNGRPPSVSVSFLVQDKPFTFKNYLRQ